MKQKTCQKKNINGMKGYKSKKIIMAAMRYKSNRNKNFNWNKRRNQNQALLNVQ